MSCCNDEPGSQTCGEPMMERIRYFTGRHMSARDFRDADEYHRSFRHLHNRVLHGWGIACGLNVRLHPRPECRKDRVVVECGLALDCCGREIVVRKAVVTEPIPWSSRPKKEDGDFVLLLVACYWEEETEKVPVLYSAQACSSPAQEWGRIRECFKLSWLWVKRDDLPKHGWQTPSPCAPVEPPPSKDPSKGAEQYGGKVEPHPVHTDDPIDPRCCLDLDCSEDHCVPLAVIEGDGLSDQKQIDQSGRRSVQQAREHLTHICWISWRHGGLMKMSELGSLQVRFDRPLREDPQALTDAGPRGINERTFVVQYGEQDEDYDFVRYHQRPHLAADRRTAVFELNPGQKLKDHVVHVTLRCDFLLDCHGNPVDGDHLRGQLPSGNGVPGGVFESWFTVVSDADYDKLMQQNVAGAGASPKDQGP